ncbi:MAG: AzlD domain-containing protein [Peptococcaceae bacterium]|nr:AzlD domain-containing protein [Peptococcaceae bacterium]
MASTDIFLLIAGMMAVTYIPRAIPAVLVDKMKFGSRTEKFLKLIPYTAMAALIFPGVFLVDKMNPIIGIVGGAVAIVLAMRKCQIMVCVLVAIAVDFVLYLFL